MRHFLGLFVLASLFTLGTSTVTGCGRGGSESLGDGGVVPIIDPPPPNYDAGLDAGCGPTPEYACEVPCGGGATSPECVNGYWECPSYGYGACPIEYDGGDDDGGCGELPPPCAIYCAGQSVQQECIGGQWSCVYTNACIEDAGTDAELDANPDPLFACGDRACDPETSFCEIIAGGPVNEDGGVTTLYTCNPLPFGCAPGAATCDCLKPIQASSCGCVASNGKLIETCEAP